MSVSMTNPNQIAYIKDSLKNGLGIEDIKSALRQQSLSEDQITAAINEAQGVQQPVQPQPTPSMKASPPPGQVQVQNPPEKKKGRGKVIVALIVFFILLILFLYVSVTIVGDFRTMFPNSGDILPGLTDLGG